MEEESLIKHNSHKHSSKTSDSLKMEILSMKTGLFHGEELSLLLHDHCSIFYQLNNLIGKLYLSAKIGNYNKKKKITGAGNVLLHLIKCIERSGSTKNVN